MLGLPDDVAACLFDLDCVLAETAAVHNLDADTRQVLDLSDLAELLDGMSR